MNKYITWSIVQESIDEEVIADVKLSSNTCYNSMGKKRILVMTPLLKLAMILKGMTYAIMVWRHDKLDGSLCHLTTIGEECLLSIFVH